jgi:hypothetical protein
MNTRTACLLLALCTAGAWWPAHAQNVDTSIVKLPQDITYKGLLGAPQHVTLFGDPGAVGTAEKCQEQTHAPQQTIRIDFDLIDPNQHADSAPRQEFPIGSITIASDQSA